jgi:sugar lactone lactonase YvrE
MNLLLGEGPIWNRFRQSWCWFDIINNTLFELPHLLAGISKPACHKLPITASTMAVVDNEKILVISAESISIFNLETQVFKVLKKLSFSNDMRTNDGGMGPDGRMWFSTMEKKPLNPLGCIYSINSQLEVELQIEGVTIPNTMAWDILGNELYLSDSFIQKTLIYNFTDSPVVKNNNVFLNKQKSNATPDGGAFDHLGNLWIALWGGGVIACFDPHGNNIREIKIPVPQPSSCCFGGPTGSHLFITTAREGLSEDLINKYPLSGSVFIIDVGVKGAVIPEFNLEFSC